MSLWFWTGVSALVLLAVNDLDAEQPALQPRQAAAEIDRLLSQSWQKDGIKANAPLSDEGFVRRIYLDVAGRIPTHPETLQFLNSQESGKRAALIDQLLASEGHVQHMFHFWADILRANTRGIGPQGNMTAQPYIDYLKESLRENKPYDRLVHELIAAEGTVWQNPAIGYYMRDIGMPLDNLANTSRIFLGTRIECAQCHNDPFDKWTQKQFYQMAAFTYGIETNHPGIAQMDGALKMKNRDERAREALMKKGTEAERAKAAADQENYRWVGKALDDLGDWVRYSKIHYLPRRELRLPHDYQYTEDAPKSLVLPATMMGHTVAAKPGENPQKAYADWLTSPENPRFTTVIANRLWKKVFGLGLIEPVDQMRDDTVASHPELMKYLEKLMIAQRYDMRAMLRVLYNTQAYQQEASKAEIAPGEVYHFTGPILRRMTPEQMWDSFVTLIQPTPDLPRAMSPEVAAALREARVRKVSDALDMLTAEELFDGAMKSSLAYQSISTRARELRGEYEAAQKAKDKKKVAALGDEIRNLEYKARSSVNDHLVVPAVARLYKKVTGTEPSETLVASLGEASPAGASGQMMAAARPSSMKERVYIPVPGYEINDDGKIEQAASEAARVRIFEDEARRYQIPAGEVARYVKARKTQAQEWPRAADMASPGPIGHYLREFGQSDRDQIENANHEASIAQALVLMNSRLLPEITQPYSQVMLSAAPGRSPEERVAAVYLAFFSRRPTSGEMEMLLKAREKGLDEIDDLIHALINTREFIFVR